MRFLLFGIGEYYNRYKIWFTDEQVVALIDNSKDKQGTYIDGKKVISPEEVCKMEFDAIIIMSFYIKAMKNQLIELGIDENKIYHFYELHDLIYNPALKKKINYYGCKDESVQNLSKKILLLNQDLTLGGPAIALYHMAQVLKKNGYHVTYGSMIDGPLRDILTREGISVIVDENLLIETMKESGWIKEYSLVICNTINFHVFLSERDKSVPFVWWLHDALFFYDGVSQKAINNISTENLKIWAVGPVSENAIKTFRPDFQVEDLLYGVEDTYKTTDCVKSQNKVEKIYFVTIGYIEERKGQDILFQAIKKMAPEIRSKAVFYFVGRNTSNMAQDIMYEANDIPEIHFTGLLDRVGIDSVLKMADMMICPSREDPMPTVVAEAMMHKVPCIISDAAGTVKYIQDDINGIIFKNEDVQDLKNKIEKYIRNKLKYSSMSDNARQVYEKYFSMDSFEYRLMQLIRKITMQ